VKRLTTFSPKAFIFDLDGVLWDSNDLHAKAFQEVCEGNNLVCPDYALLAGRTTPEAWDFILERNVAAALDLKKLELTEAKRSAFLRLSKQIQVESLSLSVLRQTWPNVPFAIVTGASSETLNTYLSHLPGDILFSVLISASDGLPSKPLPDSYLECMNRLELEASACLILEDSVSGLEAAIASGAKVVHITGNDTCKVHELRGERSSVYMCVGSVSEFAARMKS
jgi:beta-phosphoglucomutase-like phosphatase (HAD superfamily)